MKENKNNNLPWLIVVGLVVVLAWLVWGDGGSVTLPVNSTVDTNRTSTESDVSLERVIIVEQHQQVDVSQPTPLPQIVVEPLPTTTSEPTPTPDPTPTPVPTPFPRPLTLEDYNWCSTNNCANAGCDGVCE